MVEMLLSEFEKQCKSIEFKMCSLGFDNLDRCHISHGRYYDALQIIKKQAKIKNPSKPYQNQKIEVELLQTKDRENPLPFPVDFRELERDYLN